MLVLRDNFISAKKNVSLCFSRRGKVLGNSISNKLKAPNVSLIIESVARISSQPQIPHDRRFVIFAVMMLLSIQSVLLAYSATKHSPTMLEPGFLAAGIYHWKFGRYELFRVNPPLVRMVAATPVMVAGHNEDWGNFYEFPGARSAFNIGADFVKVNGRRSIWLFTIARWSCIPFCLAGGLFCFFWSRELWQSNFAGLITLTLWCFSPNILAHGELITTDCAATSLGIGASYLFWRWLQQPTWKRAFFAGLVLGLAELTKTTWAILFGLWPLLWLCRLWMTPLSTDGEKSFGTIRFPNQTAQLGIILLLGLYVINLGYLFDGSFTKLKDYTFVSSHFTGTETRGKIGNRFADTWIGLLPVPVPKQYLLGLDIQMRDFDHYAHPSYLRGEWRHGGWWYYYLYGLAVKTPHGTQVLFTLAVLIMSTRVFTRRTKLFAINYPQPRDLMMLLVPGMVIMILVSAQLEFNHHLRYVLPVLGFAFVYCGQVIFILPLFKSIIKSSAYNSIFNFVRILLIIIIVGSLLAVVVSLSSVYPHQLTYFNELAGGPENGEQHLLHSNVDWGQGLIELKHWVEKHPERQPVYLAYYGFYDPTHIGLSEMKPIDLNNSDLPTSQQATDFLQPGWYAISKNFVNGCEWFGYDGSAGRSRYNYKIKKVFSNKYPVESFAHSIQLFHVPAKSISE